MGGRWRRNPLRQPTTAALRKLRDLSPDFAYGRPPRQLPTRPTSFRVRAADRKAHREVQLREAELNDGYPELAYVGFLTVTTRDPGDLDDLAGLVEQTAAHAGIQLHPLYAR